MVNDNRGKHPNSKANLAQPFGKDNPECSPEKLAENGSKGGTAKAKNRLRRMSLSEITDLLLSKKATTKTVKTVLELHPDLNPDEITNDVAMTARQIEKAIKKADTHAFEVLQATVGESPTNKVSGFEGLVQIVVSSENDKKLMEDI